MSITETKRKLKVILGGFLVLSFLVLPSLIKAVEKEETRAKLNGQITDLQQQIKDYQFKIGDNQQKAKSLVTEIQILEDKIATIRLQVQQTDLAIQGTSLGIDDLSTDIGNVETRIDQQRIILAEYIRVIDRYDQETLLEIVLTNNKLSDFFDEVTALESVQGKIFDILDQIRDFKTDLEEKKSSLEDERDEQYRLKSLQVIQRRSVEGHQGERENLLDQTKGEEKRFQQLITKSNQDIEFIKKQIYMLEGVGLSMSLEQALSHALFATSRTGVRPAFLLAIIKRESSWGTNVGTGNWRNDMHPRQHETFQQITAELGLDPDTTPVSKKPNYGWGGAMGPAQFMPLTWMGYKDRIAAMVGVAIPDPWNIDHAFTASAIKLGAAGADQRTYAAEHKAAMIYFAGSRWNSSYYQWYGDQVMELASAIQEQLDQIQGN